MATTSVTEIFDCRPEQLYDILTDYEKYPEFLSEVKSCKVIAQEGDKPIVEYEVSIIKTIRYRLKMDQVRPARVAWSFVDGDMFKANSGAWELRDLGNGKTEVKYSIEVKFNMFVPGMIEKQLVKVNIPGMMAAYKKRVKVLNS